MNDRSESKIMTYLSIYICAYRFDMTTILGLPYNWPVGTDKRHKT